VQRFTAQVEQELAGADETALVHRMKQLVPEYRSHNSVFSSFDPPSKKP
jgi:hypothetical protein